MDDSANLILVTGSANSGKSEWAEYLAQSSNKPLIYIATAQKNEDDPEWMKKIELHQQRRNDLWQTWEIPLELPEAIGSLPSDHGVLIDSLGTWVANYLSVEDEIWQQQTRSFLDSLVQARTHPIVIVGEETGWGVVPAYELGRLFRSRLGVLIRQVGSIVDRVYLVVGGHAVDISKIGINLNSID